jgi:pimeloyl-ACP methyl ester carboxylesterase
MFVIVVTFPMMAYGSQSGPRSWKETEMDPRRVTGTTIEPLGRMIKIGAVNLLPVGSPDSEDPFCSAAEPCTFDLFYTNGGKFNTKKSEKLNILFISGGPGQFIDEGDGPGEDPESAKVPTGNLLLDNLAFGQHSAERHNIVYFHVRGTGQSMIKLGNNFDKFLRARYVVEDIEKLRQEILKDKAWDAIYAHSWGTVVAQLYARKFGTPPNQKVRSLILSAPVVRREPGTVDARVKQTVSNLADIYRFFRPSGDCAVSDASEASHLINGVFDSELFFESDLARTDNLCFLSEAQTEKIAERVAQVLEALETDYGSVGFVQDHFDELNDDLPSELRFPVEFFGALRQLQFLGAPRKEGLLLTADAKAMVDAALLIGYYLTADTDQSVELNCDPSAKFFVGPAAESDVKKEYCERLVMAKGNFLKSERLQSVRANHVFGVYDGIARWVFRMLDKTCFTGTDLMNFANGGTGTSDKKRFVRALARKIGLPAKDEPPVCGWDPGGENAHNIPTVILAGNTDAIIAGCQAEDFYNRGLRGPKVFLRFPGQGHAMKITNLENDPELEKFQQTKNLANLIEKFIKAAISNPSAIGEFSGSVKPELDSVRAHEPKLENGAIPCP